MRTAAATPAFTTTAGPHPGGSIATVTPGTVPGGATPTTPEHRKQERVAAGDRRGPAPRLGVSGGRAIAREHDEREVHPRQTVQREQRRREPRVRQREVREDGEEFEVDDERRDL
nr:hypothetical protein [Halobaculum sp. DT92]